MKEFTVLESQGGKISSLISQKLRKISCGDTLILSENACLDKGLSPSLVVVPPNTRGRNILANGQCGILLVPSEVTEPVSGVRPMCIVSYGLSNKDSITLSSLAKDRILMTIQRDLPTVDGGLIERQEVPVRHPENVSSQEAMAAAAALLILGADPNCGML